MLVEAEKAINRRPISFQWKGGHAGSVPLPIYPEQFLISPRDTVEEQRDFNVSEDLRLRKMYVMQLSEIWEREYLHQVLGSKGEVWQSTPNPLRTGERNSAQLVPICSKGFSMGLGLSTITDASPNLTPTLTIYFKGSLIIRNN